MNTDVERDAKGEIVKEKVRRKKEKFRGKERERQRGRYICVYIETKKD